MYSFNEDAGFREESHFEVEPSGVTSNKRAALLDPWNICASSIDLSNTIMGTGLLSVPFAFSRVGLGSGILLTLLSMGGTWFSLQILVSAATRAAPAQDHHLDVESPFTTHDPHLDVESPFTTHDHHLDNPHLDNPHLDIESPFTTHDPRQDEDLYADPTRRQDNAPHRQDVPITQGQGSLQTEEEHDDGYESEGVIMRKEEPWGYGWLAHKAWKSPRAAISTDLAMALSALGFAVSYLVAIGDSLPQAVRDMLPSDWLAYNTTLTFIITNRYLWITLLMIWIGPLSFAVSVDEFWWFATVTLSCALYLAGIVIVCSLSIILGPSDQSIFKLAPDVTWFRLDFDAFGTIPLYIFAFTCHQNIFGVYKDIKGRFHCSDLRYRTELVFHLRRAIDFSVLGVGILYLIVGALGYITFGSDTQIMILDNFQDTIPIILGRILYACLAALSFPMQAHPCREALQNVLTMYGFTPRTTSYHPVFEDPSGSPIQSVEEQPLDLDVTEFGFRKRIPDFPLEDSRIEIEADTPGPEVRFASLPTGSAVTSPYLPNWLATMLNVPFTWIRNRLYRIHYYYSFQSETSQRHIVSFWIMAFSFLVTIFVQDLDTVLTFVGATCGVCVCYILPALLYRAFVLKREEVPSESPRVANVFQWRAVLALLLCIAGIGCGVFTIIWQFSLGNAPPSTVVLQPVEMNLD